VFRSLFDAYRIDNDLNHVTNLLFIASCIFRAVMSHWVIYLDSELCVWRQGFCDLVDLESSPSISLHELSYLQESCRRRISTLQFKWRYSRQRSCAKLRFRNSTTTWVLVLRMQRDPRVQLVVAAAAATTTTTTSTTTTAYYYCCCYYY
jgi:hypothetical protein